MSEVQAAAIAFATFAVALLADRREAHATSLSRKWVDVEMRWRTEPIRYRWNEKGARLHHRHWALARRFFLHGNVQQPLHMPKTVVKVNGATGCRTRSALRRARWLHSRTFVATHGAWVRNGCGRAYDGACALTFAPATQTIAAFAKRG